MKQKFYFPHLHESETNIEGSPVSLTIDSSSNYEAPGDCFGYFMYGPTMDMECTIWKDGSPIKKLEVNARVAPVDVYAGIGDLAYNQYQCDDDYRKEVNEKVMEEYPDELKDYNVNDNIYDAIDYEHPAYNKFGEILNSYMSEAEYYQLINDAYADSDYDVSGRFTIAFAKFIEDSINGSDDWKYYNCRSEDMYAGAISSIKKAV